MIMEKQSSFRARTMEKQQSIRSVTFEKQPSIRRVMEKQQSFNGESTDKPPSALGPMEKQQSFHGVTIDKQPSTRGVMEKQKSFRGFIEKQKSFRVVMERQLSFIGGGERKKNKDSPGKRGDLQLHLAARAGNLSRVMEILQSCDANEAKDLLSKKNQEGETPLYVAAESGHALIVEEMLQHMNLETASIPARNGYDSFHVAAKQGHLVVKALVSKDPSTGFRTDKKGQTALHMAVKGQNEDIVLELIRPDPSVLKLEDNKGNTALHIAIKKGRTQIVRCLLSIEGIDVNSLNKAGESPLDVAEKLGNTELFSLLKEAGAAHSKDHGKPPSATKQLKQTVSDIKHDVQSQLQQSRQTGFKVHKIAKKLKKLHISGLNNAINSSTVVAVLIATVAFAAIFTVPGQYVEEKTEGFSLGQAHIAKNAAFIIFFVFDSLALFISLAVVVVQTSVVVIEEKAKRQLVFVINKLMWLACLFISIAFISLTYVVVGEHSRWLAVSATVIGGTIMLTTIGSMCYCVILHRMEAKKLRNIRKAESRSRSFSMSVASDQEILNSEYKRMYAL
ncbi:hypothetical protein CISIN_1g006802mg [Citrus sinensis]|uniref:PGG domain-containing protein n=1 Tax=Citrus sinensis TaxID=2711 RepID=A0A067EK66_CITSI|nr:hypothetical protein CISIN_1g006802mg [Citrus sinensis]